MSFAHIRRQDQKSTLRNSNFQKRYFCKTNHCTVCTFSQLLHFPNHRAAWRFGRTRFLISLFLVSLSMFFQFFAPVSIFRYTCNAHLSYHFIFSVCGAEVYLGLHKRSNSVNMGGLLFMMANNAPLSKIDNPYFCVGFQTL